MGLFRVGGADIQVTTEPPGKGLPMSGSILLDPADNADLEVAVAEALFCSWLQPADAMDLSTAKRALRASLSWFAGPAQIAEVFAEHYGEEPERAAARMRWCLDVAAHNPALAVDLMSIAS